MAAVTYMNDAIMIHYIVAHVVVLCCSPFVLLALTKCYHIYNIYKRCKCNQKPKQKSTFLTKSILETDVVEKFKCLEANIIDDYDSDDCDSDDSDIQCDHELYSTPSVFVDFIIQHMKDELDNNLDMLDENGETYFPVVC
eukprot:988387_1